MTAHRAAWVAGLLITAACSLSPSLAAEVAGAGANWAHVGGGSGESGFSRLDRISVANVGRLGLAWYLDLPGEISLEATPVAVGGVLYFTGSYGVVYAVDGVSGKSLWRFDPQTWKYDPAKLHYML